jgi:hypothetical protein
MERGGLRVNLETLLTLHAERFLGDAIDVYKETIILCPPGTRVVGPDDGVIPLKPIACVHVQAGITKAKRLIGPVMFDPYLLVPPVRVTDLATGVETTFDQHGLAVGINTKFEQGKFYESHSLASFYYCDRIEGATATLYLVESFQSGRLIQAHLQMQVENQRFYVPVSDKAVIQRLDRRLEELKNATK